MKKVDELTKNRREMDSENISGHMPKDREMPEYILQLTRQMCVR
jgi:hypothetical protein